MSVRHFVLARLAEETVLTQWADAIASDVDAGLGVFELRQIALSWLEHPDFQAEWRLDLGLAWRP